MKTSLASGNCVIIRQETDYPRNAAIEILISMDKSESFPLALRIPYWSRNTSVRLNGKEMAGVKHGDYLRISREWKTGDAIRIEMDFRLQFWRHPDAERLHRQAVECRDWEAEWALAGPPRNRWRSPAWLPSAELMLDGAVTMGEVVGAESVVNARASSASGCIEFGKYFADTGPHGAAWCLTEFEVPTAGMLPILIGCDYWYSCFVNGELVACEAGQVERTRQFDLKLKAGRNLIGFRVTAGTGGWMLSLGKGEFVPEGAKPVAATSGETFASIYRGPVLLAYDARFNDEDFAPESVPSLGAPMLKLLPEWKKVPSDNPLILLEGKDADGKPVRYCDFASAGATGNYYQSWVPVGFTCPEVEFSRENPRRS